MRVIDRILIVGFALTFIDLILGRQVSESNPGLFILSFEMIFAFYGVLYLLPMVIESVFNRSTRNKIMLITPIILVYLALNFVEIMKTDYNVQSNRGLSIDGEIIFVIFAIGYIIALTVIRYWIVRKHDIERTMAQNE